MKKLNRIICYFKKKRHFDDDVAGMKIWAHGPTFSSKLSFNMAAEAKALLDELMGRARNLDPSQQPQDITWHSTDVIMFTIIYSAVYLNCCRFGAVAGSGN